MDIRAKRFLKYVDNLNLKYDINIDVFVEENPLGECGAFGLLKKQLCKDFVFINGDLIFSIDFNKLIYFHKRISSYLTLVTHTSDHPNDSDLVSAPNGSLITDIFFQKIIIKQKIKKHTLVIQVFSSYVVAY